jgi:hypothetical protein
MMNRTAALAGLILALSAPAFAAPDALTDAKVLAAGGASGAAYDGGCTGGSCGASADGTGASRIDRAAAGAQTRGGLVTAKYEPRGSVVADVPAPSLHADKPGDKSKKGGEGFFSKLFGNKGVMFGAGGALVGAGAGFLLGGPIGALIGAVVGGLGGWLLSKFL